MEPGELAPQLRIEAKALRAWLRRTYPRSAVDHGARWTLTKTQVDAARLHFGNGPPAVPAASTTRRPTSEKGGPGRDEDYVVDLCDEVLGEQASRQHRFAWLQGDPGQAGARALLPVDAYYPLSGIVVEYRERQHDEPVAFFDKPDRVTVSGVHRGEQRRIYDRRRDTEIPAHDLNLVVIRPAGLSATTSGRLRRDREGDLRALRTILKTATE